MKMKFFRHSSVDLLSPTVKGTSIGAGVVYKGRKFVTHTRLSLKNSALSTLTRSQKVLFTAVFLAIAAGIVSNLLSTVSNKNLSKK